MNTNESFVTCYDKDCEEYAEILMTLVSKDKSLRNVKRDKEEFKKDRSIVSDEYVLTIGKKGSEYNSRNFKDIYNNYGIHIGYHGTKAWMYCDDFAWDVKSQFEFNKELFSFLEDLGMKTEDFDEKAQKLYKKYIMAERQEQKIKGAQENNTLSGKNAPVLYDEINEALMPILNELIIDNLRAPLFLYLVLRWMKKRRRRKNQYRFAVVLFYQNYLHDFLDINEEQNEEHNEEQNF